MVKRYIDIGHGDPEAFIWLYKDGHLWAYKAKSGTHEKWWGIDAMHYWRGRYDSKTADVSIVAPVGRNYSQPPKFLIDALEEKFGGDFELTQFNPDRVLKRRKHGAA